MKSLLRSQIFEGSVSLALETFSNLYVIDLKSESDVKTVHSLLRLQARIDSAVSSAKFVSSSQATVSSFEIRLTRDAQFVMSGAGEICSRLLFMKR